ncbi:MAG: sulfocyanin-like copper-binding protein [Alphaproteobacteria bacterium]|nr:sulfocyanin-like copper-binding protein [Alphaproteobacteria bacterium]
MKWISMIRLPLLGIAFWTLATATAEAHGSAGLTGSTLEVVLSEWSLGVRQVQANQGKLRVHVVNVGRRRHDFAVRERGASRDYYKTLMLDTNAATELSLDLPPGRYDLYCSLPGHERAGMVAVLTVSPSAPPESGGTGAN